jgi:formylglycine-generating enzyme required for sulfatase activity
MSQLNHQRGPAMIWVIMVLTLLACAVAKGQPGISNVTLTGASPQFNIFGTVGATNQVQTITDLRLTNWTVLTNILVTQSPYTFMDVISPSGPQRFYRVAEFYGPTNPPPAPPGMALIPAGTFQMGDSFGEGESYELPVHPVYCSAFYMAKYEVTMELWSTVQLWSLTNGYGYDYPGAAKATNHPVLSVDWYDTVKWCNARSQMEGRVPSYYTDAGLTQVYTNGEIAPYVNWNAGYRLPTESEWEKAARGGASGLRFPNGNTISESQANYYGDTNDYSYDLGPIAGYNPAFDQGGMPFTSPVGSFAPNGYGLYDMAGNAWEWCWDYAGAYPSDLQTDPRGPATGSLRVGRGGNWNYYAVDCRNSYRYGNPPDQAAPDNNNRGFRCALPVP